MVARTRAKVPLTQLPESDPEPELSVPDADQRALARLIRKYSPGTVAIAVGGVVLLKVGRPRRGREPNALAPLSLADTKELARLVRKHGRDVIIDAAHQIVPRGRGRPMRGDLPSYEQMHLADWL